MVGKVTDEGLVMIPRFDKALYILHVQPNALFQGGEEAMRHHLASTTDWVQVILSFKQDKILLESCWNIRTTLHIFEETVLLH